MAYSDRNASTGDIRARTTAPAVYQAELTAADFIAARALAPDLADYESYEEWQDVREGARIGLCHAGVEIIGTPVRLDRFVEWSLAARVAMTLRALDDFAEWVACFRALPDLPCVAAFDEHAVELVASRADATAPVPLGGRPLWYSSRCIRSRARTTHRVPVAMADYLAWANCLSVQSIDARLDAYAGLRAERFAEFP